MCGEEGTASIAPLCCCLLRGCLAAGTAGFTKFVIHRIEVMDSTGALEAAPGIGPGVCLRMAALAERGLCM